MSRGGAFVLGVSVAIKLSFAIMTHNERVEFSRLMKALAPYCSDQTEIVVLDDFSEPDMVAEIQRHDVRFYQRALNKRFAPQRNYLKSLCRGETIFVIDCDEIPSTEFLDLIPKLTAMMEAEGVPVVAMPRLNVILESPEVPDSVEITDAMVAHMKACPDYQIRLLRNLPQIQWEGCVHEKTVGVEQGFKLKDELKYALIHIKTAQKQTQQNKFYRGIFLRYLDKARKSLRKRLKRAVTIQWILIDPLG